MEPLNIRTESSPISSGPHDVTARSVRSKEDTENSGNEEPNLFENPRPPSPVFSTASMHSDWSMGKPENFRTGNEESSLFENPRPVSPGYSTASMHSDWSMGKPENFRTGNEEPRPVPPASSDGNMRNDRSKKRAENSRNEESRLFENPRPPSPVFSTASMHSDRSMGKPENFRTGNEEPSSLQKSTPETSPTQSYSRTPNRPEDPLDFRQESNAKRQLIDNEKNRVLAKYENELRGVECYSELHEIVNKKDKGQLHSYNNMFINSEGETVRTVLTEGVAGVGKTFHTKMFMLDWAKGNSNKHIDLIIPLDFRELNDRKDKVQTMEELLDELLTDDRQRQICKYNSKLAFVLDGLENCKLPLKFKKNKIVTDKKEPATINVLLTNLITGKLLPNACIWITSQPSAVKKIPSEYIHKVTECKETKETLTKEGKKKILAKYENELKQAKVDSELLENKKAQTYSELFGNSKKPNMRTVLTKGVAGVGKTFHAKMFMLDWAKGNSNKHIDLIIPLDFRELNDRKDIDQSMEDLLREFIDVRIFKCKSKVAFVLDGLEECEVELNFENTSDLSDMKKAARMDVLLTNLIKGKLLLTADLWIISRPSGVHKIPPEYIQKVTECRETKKRQQRLESSLKTRLLRENSQAEDITHPNQENTEHITRNKSSGELPEDEKHGQNPKSVTKVNKLSDIFGKEKNIRTVLTVGEPNIGKSFSVQKYVKEWAKSGMKSFWSFIGWNSEVEFLFPFNISKLGSIKEREISLVGLLNHFFEETKQCVISDYTQIKVLFVLDGLDQYTGPLDFDNNKTLTDVREKASVDVLLTNLIKGKLLPSAKVWITSRPSAAERLPDDCIHRKTEIREKPDLVSQRKVRSQLKEQFHCVAQGIDKQETSVLLNEIYTDLYIIEGDRGEVNQQSENRQVQQAKFNPMRQETPIKYCDIFKPPSDQHPPIKTVLTIGVAGIGKSFASMKYMLDWAEEKALKDIHYTFPLPFRELNLRRDGEHSLEELLHQFFPAMQNSEITDYNKYQILIVLDGFDECRLDLDFRENDFCTEMTQKTSVNVLLTNLIMGNLLPNAQVWITSRPGASNNIPPKSVHRVTEVRGFNDEQKEEYFRKRFSDKDLAEKILSHVKKSRSLYIMCHIPVFCWITSTVLEDFVSRNQEEGMPKTMTDMPKTMTDMPKTITDMPKTMTDMPKTMTDMPKTMTDMPKTMTDMPKTMTDMPKTMTDMPRTMTDMYVHFLLLQCRQANVKYGSGETGEGSDSCWNTRNKKPILSLGKLAFEQLEKGNLFTEENLTECGIDVTEAAIFSGVFTQIKREGCGFYDKKLFCFVHLSVQEFLAAFYVFHTFNTTGENLLSTQTSVDSKVPESDFYKKAVDKALDSKNGNWDLFVRFLLGLSLETNQRLLKDVLKKTENDKKTYEETVGYIKEKIKESTGDADRNLNLFYCLNELNDNSLVDEVKKYLQSGKQAFENFSASQWSALTYVLLTSDENLEEFDLKKYRRSEEVFLGMLPVVKVSKTSLLSWCNLSENSCIGLTSSVLSSASSNLTTLDLSHNDLKDSGVQRLADGLKSLHCKLENLKLAGCQVTEVGCSFLVSALESNTAACLKELDLSYNHPGEEGKNELRALVEDPHRKLTSLCFDHCGEHRLKPGLKKYGADLRLDETTASRRLVLSEDRRRVEVRKEVAWKVEGSRGEDIFKRTQVFCDEGQSGFCYWEVEWEGTVGVAVAYRRLGRNWDSSGGLGCNYLSWSLLCSSTADSTEYQVMHGKTVMVIKKPRCQKIAVWLDWEGGTLSYYSVSSGELSLIHTFKATFTDPLFPGFWFKSGSVTLSDIE